MQLDDSAGRSPPSSPNGRATGEGEAPAGRSYGGETLALRLEYRPPLDWAALLDFLTARAASGVELVDRAYYARTLRIGSVVGHVVVRPAREGREALIATIPASLATCVEAMVPRLRDLFDLDANPHVISETLRHAGLIGGAAEVVDVRIPGTVDGFELAVRAILGQQVSVKGATTLMGRYVSAFGEAYAGGPPGLSLLTPRAERIAALETKEVTSLGLPSKRAETIVRLAGAVAAGTLTLHPGVRVERAMAGLTAIPGIGDWTAHYIAMRALRWPDAFPASDLGLRRGMGGISAAELGRRAESWRPWRAYVAMYLWKARVAGPSSHAGAGG